MTLRLPRTILELGRMFSSEEKCMEYMREIRWPHGFKCPKCSGSKHYWISTRGIIKCAECGEQIRALSWRSPRRAYVTGLWRHI